MPFTRTRTRNTFPVELAGAFAFGGEQVQAQLLEEDGVEVVDGKVDLDKYGIQINS